VSDQRGRRCPAVIAGADEPQVQGKASFPFLRFNSSPAAIRLVVMMYVRFLLSLRNVEDLLFERGIDICHETVRMWWNRFGPMFVGNIRRQQGSKMRGFCH
jgi:putative transposase